MRFGYLPEEHETLAEVVTNQMRGHLRGVRAMLEHGDCQEATSLLVEAGHWSGRQYCHLVASDPQHPHHYAPEIREANSELSALKREIAQCYRASHGRPSKSGG